MKITTADHPQTNPNNSSLINVFKVSDVNFMEKGNNMKQRLQFFN